MKQEELNEVIRQHSLWLADSTNGERANLSGASLEGANLEDANLIGANLSGANLIGANLRGANLIVANLTDANLIDASLEGANLSGASLKDANLSGANLEGANLRGLAGNNREIKSIHCSQYVITYTDNTMAIGCKQYLLKEWFNFNDAQIKEMAIDALEWWHEWKPKLIALGVFDSVIKKQEGKSE